MRAPRIVILAATFLLLAASFASADPSPLQAYTFVPKGAAGQSPQPEEQIRRFALVVGSDGGGPGTIRLRYAGSDAKSFADVMTELGGVSPSDLTLLLDPGLASIDQALTGLRDEVASTENSGMRSEFIFYYSGHSDETGLLLGPERLGYSDLRAGIEGVRADLRVAILDSCASGAMTRAKGGTFRPAFVFDESSDMKGHAYLTSSSAAEAAQESDRLGGSYFTHYLVSGLRGAADDLGQGRVTLNEAYAYAFKETLASTEQTQFGPQHPAYDINLTGTGDLVLTDLRSATAVIVFAEDIQGHVFVRDDRGVLAVELSKARGKRVGIGIEPGDYSIVVDDGERHYSSDLVVAKGGHALLSAGELKPLAVSASVARGPLLAGGAEVLGAPVTLQILPDFGQALFTSAVDRFFAINATLGTTRKLEGFEVAGLVNTDSLSVAGFQAAGLANVTLGSASGFQAAGLVNYAGGDMSWFHAAGLANIIGGRVAGAEIAGLANVARARRVLYAGNRSQGFIGEASPSSDEADFGFQAAGLANWTVASAAGVEVAGILNRSGDFAGLQAATVNFAEDMGGLQVGVINDSGRHRGGQIGVVNVAGELWGAQIGLVNIADRIHGPAFGLVSVEKGGILAFEGTGDPNGDLLVSFKFGTRYSYTIASVGMDTPQEPKDWSFGLGLGYRVPLGPYFFDADAQWRAGYQNGFRSFAVQPSQSAVGRILFGGRVEGPLALVGGVSVELRIPGLTLEAGGSAATAYSWTPEFVFGIQL